MRLTKLVPALGLFAAIAAPVSAIELADGTLTIGGHVDVVLMHQQAEPRVGDSSSTTDFNAEAYLSVAYRVGEDVEAFIGILAGDADAAVGIEEAYISWGFADNLSLTVGKYVNWLVSESGAIDDTLTDTLTGIDVTGIALGYSMEIDAESSFDVALHVVERIWDFPRVNESDLAVGLGGAYTNAGLGTIGGSVNFQAISFGGSGDSALGVNLFAEITAVEDFTFGVDLHYVDFDTNVGGLESVLGAGAYVNYSAIPTPFPSSVTLALSYLRYDTGATTSGDFKVQAAYLTNPTGNDNFEVNFEVNYTAYDEDGPNGAQDYDLGLFLQFVAYIP